MKSISVIRKKRGRPATGQDPVTAIRLSAELRAKIDSWARKQPDAPARSEAIRRLVELALTGERGARARSPKARARAHELASTQLDTLIDPSVRDEERQQKKRRLLKGPKEFREMRAAVHSKAKD